MPTLAITGALLREIRPIADPSFIAALSERGLMPVGLAAI
jgi:hypothetical protein